MKNLFAWKNKNEWQTRRYVDAKITSKGSIKLSTNLIIPAKAKGKICSLEIHLILISFLFFFR